MGVTMKNEYVVSGNHVKSKQNGRVFKIVGQLHHFNDDKNEFEFITGDEHYDVPVWILHDFHANKYTTIAQDLLCNWFDIEMYMDSDGVMVKAE